MVETHRLYTYPFEGYWVDVGTVDAYWSTSMELVSGKSQLDLYDTNWVIHTKSEERAPAKIGPAGPDRSRAWSATAATCGGR